MFYSAVHNFQRDRYINGACKCCEGWILYISKRLKALDFAPIPSVLVDLLMWDVSLETNSQYLVLQIPSNEYNGNIFRTFVSFVNTDMWWMMYSSKYYYIKEQPLVSLATRCIM